MTRNSEFLLSARIVFFMKAQRALIPLAVALGSLAFVMGATFLNSNRSRKSHQSPRLTEGRLIGTPVRSANSTKDIREEPQTRGYEQNAQSSLMALLRQEKALAKHHANASLLSDLSALSLEAFRRTSDHNLVLEALDAADEAVRLAPNLPEARFNLALALEHLFLVKEAEKAWVAYLRLDRDSEWADKARAHYMKLRQPMEEDLWKSAYPHLLDPTVDPRSVRTIVGMFPQETRSWIEDELLPQWASHVKRENLKKAESLLDSIDIIARELYQLTGDSLLFNAVADLKNARLSTLGDLIEAHELYGDASAEAKQNIYARTRARFEQAERLFSRANSPFTAWAAFQKAHCDYQRAAYAEALQTLNDILGDQRYSGLIAVRGRALWLKGTIASIGGRPSDALDAYVAALPIFSRLGELSHVVAVRTLLASNYEFIGDRKGAWAQRYEALKGLAKIRNTLRIRVTLGEAASSVAADHPRAAFYIQGEMFRRIPDPNPQTLATMLRQRAAILLRLNEISEAAEDLAVARLAAVRIQDPDVQTTVLGELLMIEALARASTDPDAALSLAADAIEIHEQKGYHFFLAQLHLERARLMIARKEYSLAEAVLEQGMREREKERESISDLWLRICMLDKASTIFDEAITLAMTRGKYRQALSYAERGRARTLLEQATSLDQVGNSSIAAAPLGTYELLRTIPIGTELVEYEIQARQAFVWVLRRGELKGQAFAIDAQEIETLTKELRAATAGVARRAAIRLYDILIRPIAGYISEETLIIVPDSALHRVSFSALFNRNSGKYLLEERRLVLAPSASLFMHAMRRKSILGKNVQSLAIVSDPEHDREAFPMLPRLRGAAREAERILDSYPNAELLSGSQATVKAFLSLAPRSEAIHYAGHVVGDDGSPFSAGLLLSPGNPRAAGVLYARDLLARRFPVTKLVVLSGCRSGTADETGAEGPLSLVYPFLASGIPTVVATLWNVEDDVAVEVADQFYHGLKLGHSVLDALRGAQLALLRRHGKPSQWGAFEVLGAF